jgi:alpha,alpha-trehalase
MQAKAQRYHRQAQARKRRMMQLLWDERRGFFFDYDFRRKKRNTFFSLAGFYPLWAGMPSVTQAERMLRNLKRFEQKGGLVNTQRSGLLKPFRQWDFPNGWPNQQWIVIKGLWDYGFIEDARRLATKWLDLNVKIFRKTGQFWEKYDVVHEKIGRAGHYPTRAGFGWTNAIFVRLVQLLQEKQ